MLLGKTLHHDVHHAAGAYFVSMFARNFQPRFEIRTASAKSAVDGGDETGCVVRKGGDMPIAGKRGQFCSYDVPASRKILEEFHGKHRLGILVGTIGQNRYVNRLQISRQQGIGSTAEQVDIAGIFQD